MAGGERDESSGRFLIGIDLGTTNSAVAYVDTADAKWAVRDVPVPQLVSPGEVEARETLPSFHYEAAAREFPPGALRLPWSAPGEAPRHAVGFFARDHGAAVPGRLIVSAKSWLSHSGVDRTAGLLPWHGASDVQRLSPVETSSRYLAHVRAAWDTKHPGHPMAEQDVVLTVPASFDEVARELTVQAARAAGLVRVVLVEEPQAAFYAWIHAQGGHWDQRVRPGQTILVCDVGGGTSDFTLIRVRPAGKAGEGRVLFHRVAVGEHLILGGDNLDLALAHHVEKRLTEEGRLAGGANKLEPRHWGPLVRTCRVVKETLLGKEAPQRMTVNVSGGGARLIGSAIQIEVTREEVERVLVDGFLPFVRLDERPVARRSGFQEFGLPFAPDPAITKYLAAFLTAHAAAAEGDRDAARPDLVLFNGGLFESPVLRERLLAVLSSWFNTGSGGDGIGDWKLEIGDCKSEISNLQSPISNSPVPQWCPTVLKNARLDLAVARGAAYYGMVRRGRGVRITGGLAHSYYLGVDTGRPDHPAAVCLLPAGVEEGQTVELSDRTFELLIRQPAEFPLYYSSTRTTDAPGALLEVDGEQISPLPPIRTVLQSGRKSAADTVPVRLNARLTEIGTLDIWCAEARGDRQWRLQFDVRAATRADAARHEAIAEAQGVVDERTTAACRNLIRAAFRKGPPPQNVTDPPAGVVKRLEQATGMTRWDWPASLMRALWETLMELESGRRISVDHESRWLSLTGFCLRPGYGLAVDDWRVAQTWKLYPAELAFPKNELCRAEWWILWRRVAGGLSPGQQATLAEPLLADWRTYLRKGGSAVRGRSPTFQFGPHESAEVWRLLGSLELLKPAVKTELGGMILERLPKEKVTAVRDALLFALGRIGARVPVYGPLDALLGADTAQAWAGRVMALHPPEASSGGVCRSNAERDDKPAFSVVQLTRRTGDRYRDVSDEARQAALQWLAARGATGHLPELVRDGGALREEDQRSVFGESLPRGLRIE